MTQMSGRARAERRGGGPKTADVTCPYCGGLATFMPDSSTLYNGRDFGAVYHCAAGHEPAWVGVHKGTLKPLGRLADRALRRAKQDAHAAFDPMWKTVMERDAIGQNEARKRGYAWLAGQMGLPPEGMHVGMLDIEQCQRVVAICSKYRAKATA